MNASEVVDILTLRNRAYQVLYALGRAGGDQSFVPDTLTTSEAICLVEIVRNMDGSTYLELLLDRCWSYAPGLGKAMKQYITEGSCPLN